VSGRTTNYSVKLRRAMAEGAEIVGAVEPRVGWKMAYLPRRKGDPKPWRAEADPLGPRFTGRECKAVTANGGGPWTVARLLP
jgi:hypothetical protein